jgi:hypothetical protein
VLRSVAISLGLALVLMLATRQIGTANYSASNAYRLQVAAFLDGRLALDPGPGALAHDRAWTPGGVQQVWGLGVPLWQTPFELAARAIGQGPFPDRIPMLIWIAISFAVVLRAFRRDGEPWWVLGGIVLLTVLLPPLITMLYGRIGVYEEAAAYAYMAALMMLGGLVAFARAPTPRRYLLLLAAAGLTGLIRPTAWFYGLATAILATVMYVRATGRRALAIVAIGAALFVAGGAVLYATNAVRFGKGSEFGHRLNIEALPGNVYATRFSYPFERAGFVEASVELVGSLFGRPEANSAARFYEKQLHPGQSDTVRWREYYFTTFSWPYLPLILAGLVLGVIAWRRRTEERWLALWAVLGAGPLVVFYLHSPSVSSRYQLDLAPAIAALLVIVWRAVAIRGRLRWIAPVVLLALWVLAIVTSEARGRGIAARVDRDLARRLDALHEVMDPSKLPASYDLADPQLETWLDADGRPPQLYLNGSGWHRPDGHVAPTVTLFVVDPQFLEVDVEPASAQIQAVIGLDHLALASTEPTPHGARMRFTLPAPKPGLQVAFIAFGPDTDIDRPLTDIVLRRVRWR